jgi:acetyltransferase
MVYEKQELFHIIVQEDLHHMNFFFDPEGVAVIGASADPMKVGYYILRNTLGGYKGKVYPVNPRYETLQGVQCYPDVESIPESFELAIYFIPARFLPDTIRACAKKGVKGIIIESAGFAEVGEAGRQLQEESVRLAKEFGIRLWGPNCMGLIDGYKRHVFSFLINDQVFDLLKPGNASFIVQSGMLSAGFLLMMLERGGLGISKMCSIGNKCDVHETELLEYLIGDDSTDVIGMYVESIKDPQRFMECARSSKKPIVMLKGGQSPVGAQAAASHTASMAGNYTIMRHVFDQCGITEVFDINELMDIVRGFSKTRLLRHDGGTAILTFSGGGGIITSDLLHARGMPVASLTPESLKSLEEIFPEWMAPSHPVDIWPAIEKYGYQKVYGRGIEIIMNDPQVDSLIIHLFASRMETAYLSNLVTMKDTLGKPVIAWCAGNGEKLRTFRSDLEDTGIPVFEEMVRGVDFLAAFKRHARKKGFSLNGL